MEERKGGGRRKEGGKCLPKPELQINEFYAKPNPQRSKNQLPVQPLHNYDFLSLQGELLYEDLTEYADIDERHNKYCLFSIFTSIELRRGILYQIYRSQVNLHIC